MTEDEFELSVAIRRVRYQRDRFRIRAEYAERLLADVLEEIDGDEHCLTPETVERVCAHREWFVQNFATNRPRFRQPSENPLTDE